MANKTLLQLLASCSSLWGYEDPANLIDQDRIDLVDFINGAYFDCYAPFNGTRPWWSVKTLSKYIPPFAPTSLTLTQGSTEVSGYAFLPEHVGSFVRVGDLFMRYAAEDQLAQPWPNPSGTYDATVYHNATALGWEVIETAGQPSLLGVGLLSPLPDPDAELNLRASPAFDFTPKFSRSPFARDRRTFQETIYFDTGDPRFYHIDQASVTPTFAIGSRFHVYPIPEKAYTFEIRGNVKPVPLTEDSQIPEMPHQTVSEILLPLCREKVANNSDGRRFTGNSQLIGREGDRARGTLASLARVQRDVAGSIRLRPGW